MKKKERIVSYTMKELEAMQKRGEDRTDWARVKAMPQKEVERLADEEEGPLPPGWEKTVMIGLPPGKEAIKLRIDRDVLRWFRRKGKGYQTYMNNALRAFVSAKMQSGSPDR
jgi:uncharacterized protein (DUF4415 family)